ncbi:MAG: carboxypeptidase-like regulatory domain-containing protein [Dysgonamonadaceae bacterium]|jgi:hypothetical protein|nr:carboxypeptidase-like regulatory domain-containing protein [Dysgonamonadaceae bacterium]
MNIRFVLVFFLAWVSFSGFSRQARISGIVTDTDGVPLELVSVQMEKSAFGAFTDEKGKYALNAPKTDSCVLVFSCLGYAKTKRIIFSLTDDMTVNVRLKKTDFELDAVTVTTGRQPSNMMENIQTDRNRLNVDATGGSIESLVVTAGMGVSSSNELSTQYSVRGGNYNENIVYVNGIEVYRPILIRSGQQEGLSFINPDLVAEVAFSSGGFEARYGDKMSSVLDVTYKKPEKSEGGVTGSLLGGNVYTGNSSGKFTQITGLRYKRGTTLLKTLDEKGDYNPTAIDLQTHMTYALTPKLNLSFLGNYSENTYDFIPTNRETSFGTMDVPRKFEVAYDGAEKDQFKTLFGAAILKYDITEHADVALQASAFQSTEQENYDLAGQYWLSNVLSEDEKEITGTGSFMNHARNYLKTDVMSIALNGSFGFNQNTIRWSLAWQKEKNNDRIREWELRDSMGYSLPHDEETLRVYSNLFSKNNVTSHRFSGYLQDTYRFRTEMGLFSITAGIRGSYWNFNEEFIFSPRASMRFIPSRNENFVFRLAAGIYYQAPFYKEFRTVVEDYSGNNTIYLNSSIKSQRSIHYVLGSDYKFKFDNRPFKFTTELYYKKMDHLVPYTVNNVRIDYYGSNVSHGYSTGIDMKLFGQFVPGTDSWLSFSLMEARQYIYGEKVPMPTDQLYNFTFYFNDYAPYISDKRIQVNLRTIWAGGLPFSVPGGEYKYTRSIRTPPYRRIDIGMTYRLLDENDRVRDYSVWRYFKNVWVGIDAFNLFGIKNVSSYSWFADTGGIMYAVPDKLTGRQLNFKLVAEW